MRLSLVLIGLALVSGCARTPAIQHQSPERARLPNIIVFYADDLGYGDLGSYGAVGVETPVLDKLAQTGVRFTDAHASSATCTPSRYSLLTGEYGFRSQAEILPGDAPLLIRTDMTTLPSVLSRAGYRTGVVGKWHLGLGIGDVDWNGEVKPGPLEIGFDYSFLLPATGDRVPTVFLENHRVVGLEADDPIIVSYEGPVGDRPIGYLQPELKRVGADRQHSETIVNGISRIGFMGGGYNAEWVDEDFPFVFNEKSKAFIDEAGEQPFFLFYSFHDIHVPRLPHEQFQGVSDMGPRGDTIAQMDWAVGDILNALEDRGLTDNTLIIFTSDNGPVLDDGYDDMAVQTLGAHLPSGPLRGGKYSAFEAGARVPMIVSWPGQAAQAESAALISQVDLMASLASLVGQTLAPEEARDSQNLLGALLGQTQEGREFMFKESVGTKSLRWGDYKYIAPMPAGARIPDWLPPKGIELGLSSEMQLYDLSTDIGETTNIASDRPDIASRMQEELSETLTRKAAQGRTF